MIPTDTDSSIEFVRQFSKVYRYVLKSHEKELVEVGDELDFIDSYFYLMQKRFGASLSVNCSCGIADVSRKCHKT
jgi:two-component system, LytTR family, sensor kinase